MEEIVVYITAPDEELAVTIARALVEERLAACVNIVRDIRSIYRWEGKIEDDRELLLIAKTRRALFGRIEKKVKELHRYTVPEIISLRIRDGSPEYMEWLGESVLGDSDA